MTLRMQLNAVILSVLLMSFIGSISINILNTQSFLSGQLTSHAQDTATSLGLSLSDPIFNEETIVVEATINAIFDRGFYHHITLEGINGEVKYQRISDLQPEQVPQWFIDLFELNAPEQKTMIDTGWTIGGILKVQSHTGFAYAQLWKSANDSIHATLIIFFLALLFAYVVLQQMYKPIKAISLQAEAVQKRKFIIIEKLPRAAELRSFVLAMNKMVLNIKSTYEELTQAATETHREAYIDEQTGIENRRAFVDTMGSLLAESSEHRGHILMARINGLAELNKEQGYQAGDSLVEQLVNQLMQVQARNQVVESDNKTSNSMELGFAIGETKLFRISGSEFCLLIENNELQQLTDYMTDFISQINSRLETSQQTKTVFGFISFTSDERFGDVMYELDMATNSALESATGFTVKTNETHTEHIGSATNLKSVLDQILGNPEDHINLMQQQTLGCSDRQAFDLEIFASFTYQNNQINTGDLFSIASQFGQTGKLDLAILSLISSQFKKSQWKDKKVAINLSRLTFSDAQSMSELASLISKGGFGKSLVIGLTEDSILGDLIQSKTKIEKLNELGCAICINRFGSSIESLKYMMEIRPDLVKLSPAYTRNIETKQNNVQMVSAFIRMAHGLDITVLAQCIETQEELNTLKELKIDATLGYIINKPEIIK